MSQLSPADENSISSISDLDGALSSPSIVESVLDADTLFKRSVQLQDIDSPTTKSVDTPSITLETPHASIQETHAVQNSMYYMHTNMVVLQVNAAD